MTKFYGGSGLKVDLDSDNESLSNQTSGAEYFPGSVVDFDEEPWATDVPTPPVAPVDGDTVDGVKYKYAYTAAQVGRTEGWKVTATASGADISAEGRAWS